MGWGLLPARVPGIRRWRLAWIFVHLGLVFFSSTAIAAECSEYAFQFYRSVTGLAAGAGLHLLAQKGMHFGLFFSLGVILYFSLVAPRREKVLWVLFACLLVGCASEGLQFLFPSRHPSFADIMLNGFSGLLAAALLSVTKSPAEAQI